MDPQPDVIRQQIDETRSSLTEKLETLEAEVKGTVQSAKESVESARETVQETISTVKETVESATETVKRTIDVEYQVNRHPFAMMGLSLISGAVLGAVLGTRWNTDRRIARRMAESSEEPPERPGAVRLGVLTHNGAARPGFMDKLSSQLGDEFEKVKDQAIATLVGVVGNVARKSLPVLASTVEDMMTRAASQVGAPPQYGAPHPEPMARTGYDNPPPA